MDSFSSNDPASDDPLSRRRSMGNRRFDRYAAVLSPAPQRPARSDEPRLNWKNDVEHRPEDDSALPLHSSSSSSSAHNQHHLYQHHFHDHYHNQNQNYYQNLRRFDRDYDDHAHGDGDNHSDPLGPSSSKPAQQTTPPRWDSLSAGASPISSPTTFTSLFPTLGSLSSHRSRAESPTPASRAPPRSAFPGLCSNPFIPEDESLDRFASDVAVPLRARQFLLSKDVGEPVASSYPAPNVVDSRSIPPKSPSDGSMTVENFSRPRKPSVRSQRSETLSSRQLHFNRPQHDSTADHPLNHQNSNLNSAPSPWSRTRGLSTSSSKSSSTFASSIQPSSVHHQPSIDQLGPASRTGSLRGAPAPTSAPHSFSRPPLTSHTPLAREPPPWLTTGDEIRSSVRSQLSVSTAQGTLFTGTERSSVLTKTSSITEHSIINGYARNSWRTNSVADDGPSLEDVMGMYERGFDDSDMESVHRSMHFREDDDDFAGGMTLEVSRPASSHSNMSAVGARMLEAMNDQLPLPGALAVPTPDRSSVQESRNSFRKSLLPSSLPKDLGLGLDGHMARRTRNASQDMGKHDSGKMLDAEDDLPPPNGSSHSSPSALGSAVTPIVPPVRAQPSRPTTPAPRPTEPPEDPTSRDRYGFRKASANVTREEYDAWEATYSDYLERRRKKWVAYHKDNSLMTDHPIRFPPRNNKTKRFIRKGIPPDWRGAAWFYYAGGPAILSKHRGVYDELVKRAALDPRGPGMLPNMTTEVKTIVVEDVEKDLHRTFPDNVRFKPPQSAEPETPKTDPETGKMPETEIITSLRRVLHAFAIYNPRIGYCQSLNFLAGFLLLFVETEEQAFWLLNVITRVYLPGTHEMSLEGSKVDLGVLMQSLKDSLPAVWRQIGGDELDPHPTTKRFRPRRGTTKAASPSPNPNAKHAAADADPNRLPAITICMTAWFMSCFIGTLPTESVLRVWDVFFYEGSRTLFRIALAVFKLAEPEIKAVADPMEMFGVVQAFPRRLVDCNALMDACYRRRNGIGHLSQDAVEERRRERRDGIRRWRAEQEVAAPGDEAGMAGLDLAGEFERTRKAKAGGSGGSSGTSLFGRRKERDLEQVRAQEVM
ncbi:hypothetical protein B0T18DRAFT_415695 [Schizothecium vesticola]|uniref:Rab-GAP TBC domain-containing protein n=1 Tax=Schizothecium vesticola TaxID=314040 RepID=A0AA40EQL0_9PEZI|nr:hypothetical protein B0T18DRAFT_415695 [Schizothecium vesticola]